MNVFGRLKACAERRKINDTECVVPIEWINDIIAYGEANQKACQTCSYGGWERFYRLRKRVFDMIRKVDDGYHKSYEGAIDVRTCFDSIFEDENATGIGFVEIELHCYLLVNGRHITFYGKTFNEALDKFEDWIQETEHMECDGESNEF